MIAFERRKICVETAARYGVYTASRGDDGKVIPDARGNIVAFPYVDHGAEVSRKYRAPQKRFWQEEGGRRTFWNADVMDDPLLHSGERPLVIVEGEIDALSVLSAGYPFVVSVPDGAPSVPAGKEPEELDPLEPKAEAEGKFEFLYNNRDRLKRIKRYVIAVDSDPPGRRLAAELVRRLGAAQCSFVTYPPDAVVPVPGAPQRPCKDFNDVLMYFGSERVTQIINTAKPYPVRGLYHLSDYPEAGELETFSTGFDGWQPFMKLFLGEFIVVSGIPGHGKSAWANALVANLAHMHNWRAALFSPEMRTVPILRDQFRRIYLGRKSVANDPASNARADKWIEDHFSFIDSDPTGAGDLDEQFDLEWIIDRADDAVLRDGIRVLVIDPWNEVEHARERNESTPDYIARGIRALKRFARLRQVIVIVVAHPTKEVFRDGKHRTATLYDIDGAAHWYNKCDHGVIIQRPSSTSNAVVAHIQKVKFQPQTGVPTSIHMTYDRDSGRFTTVETETA